MTNNEDNTRTGQLCQCYTRCHSRKSCRCKSADLSCSLYCHPGRTCTNKKSIPSISSTSDLTKHGIADVDLEQDKWIDCCGFHLTREHKIILLSKAWLDDYIVGAAQKLLKQQNPKIGGFQFPALGEKLAMEPQSGEFIQIIHMSSNHWITLSTVGCELSTINLYDSLNRRLSMQAQKLVASIMQSWGKVIEVKSIDVQNQRGISDCGLFAVAFATCLCYGQDPAAINFVQERMRAHLLSCLECGYVTQFPGIQRIPTKKKFRSYRIPVYCVCRLIEEDTMIQCNTCSEWFHVTCINVPQKYIKNKHLVWNCPNCFGV